MYNQENKGLGAVRNRGMEIATGEYIYFIDSDDYLAYNTLGSILDYIIKYNLDFIGFKTMITEKLDLFNSKTTGVPKVPITNGIDFMLNNKNHRYDKMIDAMDSLCYLKTIIKFLKNPGDISLSSFCHVLFPYQNQKPLL